MKDKGDLEQARSRLAELLSAHKADYRDGRIQELLQRACQGRQWSQKWIKWLKLVLLLIFLYLIVRYYYEELQGKVREGDLRNVNLLPIIK